MQQSQVGERSVECDAVEVVHLEREAASAPPVVVAGGEPLKDAKDGGTH
jgi:hypothetical protein